MSKTDENIKNILQEKFASHESTVNPEIWNSISNSLASAPAATGAALSFSKLIGIAASIIVATASAIYFFSSEEIGSKENISATTNTSAPVLTDTAAKKIEENKSSLPTTNPFETTTGASSSHNSKENKIELITLEDLQPDGKWVDNGDVEKTSGYPNNSSVPSDQKSMSPDPLTQAAGRTEEPLSASFHTREVDMNSLRYFFFPKTNANVTFKWTSSDGYSSNDMTFSHQFAEEGNYTIELTVTDKNGNSSTESGSVRAVRPITFTIPNAFSPGINGRNDVINFETSVQNESSIISVTIQDRNGKVIYESKNSFIWDGTTAGGEMAPNGVYTYILIAIDKLGQTKMNKGTIQLFSE